jgi:hypothetical protein
MNLRKFVLAAVMVAPLTFVATSPASADPAVATVEGSGTIDPGLPTTGCANQSVDFDGTGTVSHGDHEGSYDFHFEGNSSICESLATGEGSGTLSGDISGTVSYSRTVNHVSVSGNVTFGSTSGAIVAGSCVFQPTNANPTTEYELRCTIVLNH